MSIGDKTLDNLICVQHNKKSIELPKSADHGKPLFILYIGKPLYMHIITNHVV